jgi:hypothetical protein
MRGDLSVIGLQGTLTLRQAAAATRVEVGEPMISPSRSLSSGASNLNVWVLAAIDVGVLGTDLFGGVALRGSNPFSTGTVVASKIPVARPVGSIGILRGLGETAASVDTEAEVLALLGDRMLIDYNATGGTDGGEKYTIKVAPSANTSAFELFDANVAKGVLDVTCDDRIYRNPSITDVTVE